MYSKFRGVYYFERALSFSPPTYFQWRHYKNVFLHCLTFDDMLDFGLSALYKKNMNNFHVRCDNRKIKISYWEFVMNPGSIHLFNSTKYKKLS